jgi:hypothetical protein
MRFVQKYGNMADLGICEECCRTVSKRTKLREVRLEKLDEMQT